MTTIETRLREFARELLRPPPADDDFAGLVAESFADAGLETEHARRLAEFIDAVSKVRLRAHVTGFLSRLRPSVAGTALARACGDTSESLRDAAKRLHVSPSTLARAEADFVALLSEPSIAPDTFTP